MQVEPGCRSQCLHRRFLQHRLLPNMWRLSLIMHMMKMWRLSLTMHMMKIFLANRVRVMNTKKSHHRQAQSPQPQKLQNRHPQSLQGLPAMDRNKL